MVYSASEFVHSIYVHHYYSAEIFINLNMLKLLDYVNSVCSVK